MHDDELRLAAGEMLADMTRPGGGPRWTYRGRKTWDILRDVLAAFVAGHVPADDAEPADADFVRSLGPPSRDDGNVVVVFLTSSDARPFVRVVWEKYAGRAAVTSVSVRGGDGSVFIPTPTRADVRALLRGLKVPATEGG